MVKRLEIDTEEKLKSWLAMSAGRPAAAFQGLSFIGLDEEMSMVNLSGCAFYGCDLSPLVKKMIVSAGCEIFLNSEGVPFTSFRRALYAPDELYKGYDASAPNTYFATPDWAIYLTYADPKTKRPLPTTLDEVLARRIHDFSISDNLEELLEQFPNRVIAIMGGHDVPRVAASYHDVAVLAHQLTNLGYLVVTGGGPGIMEAANLGAFMASLKPQRLVEAIAFMKEGAVFGNDKWLSLAWQYRQTLLESGLQPGRNVGVPTWFYGHEPPNPFATDIAKYFENSVREEGLLAVGIAGVIFAEGNAGTVQEIFQDACQNYYRTYGGAMEGVKSPMVLLGEKYWNPPAIGAPKDAKPVAPLLTTLAKRKSFDDYVLIIDSNKTDEIVSFIKDHPPIK